MQITRDIESHQGAGHSVGLHSNDGTRPMQLTRAIPTSRVFVNQAHTFAPGGAATNRMPFSLSMGCGAEEGGTAVVFPPTGDTLSWTGLSGDAHGSTAGLLTHGPQMGESAAFVRPPPRDGETMEATVRQRPGATVSARDLVSLCHKRLGAFRSSDAIHVLAALPKGPSGKIQRLNPAALTAA